MRGEGGGEGGRNLTFRFVIIKLQECAIPPRTLTKMTGRAFLGKRAIIDTLVSTRPDFGAWYIFGGCLEARLTM